MIYILNMSTLSFNNSIKIKINILILILLPCNRVRVYLGCYSIPLVIYIMIHYKSHRGLSKRIDSILDISSFASQIETTSI